jgi:hypothetical protein
MNDTIPDGGAKREEAQGFAIHHRKQERADGDPGKKPITKEENRREGNASVRPHQRDIPTHKRRMLAQQTGQEVHGDEAHHASGGSQTAL